MSDLKKLPRPGANCVPDHLDHQAKDAFFFRMGTATRDAVPVGSVQHPRNTDLQAQKFPNGLGTYAKGLLQSSYAIPESVSFTQFLKACGVMEGGPIADFEHKAIALGGADGLLNGPRGAFAWQQVGKDSAAFSVPAPPALDSIEYAIELVELYWASLLRDVPFSQYAGNATAQAAASELTALATSHPGKYAGPTDASGKITPDLLFRGRFAGETTGPYLSQFCLTPTTLGRVPLDQKIRTFIPGKDFMITLAEWYGIQNGAAPSENAAFDPVNRYMRCGRDTAAYTQADELYQAYLIAYLVCETLGIGRNPANPYATYTKEKPFGTLGGPDITATLGAVARAASNAVWYQKWRVHLRHRPEAGGGIVHLLKTNQLNPADTAKLASFNIVLNSVALNLSYLRNGSYLLSQAFPEGSPTHPAYPTGHGTVAGACITALKFFMDSSANIAHPWVPAADGLALDAWSSSGVLDVNGELHKLAHNVSFGHGIHAGIHWRSDTDYSILLGEQVAIDYLEDQMFSYQENFDIRIIKLDGSTHHFKNH